MKLCEHATCREHARTGGRAALVAWEVEKKLSANGVQVWQVCSAHLAWACRQTRRYEMTVRRIMR